MTNESKRNRQAELARREQLRQQGWVRAPEAAQASGITRQAVFDLMNKQRVRSRIVEGKKYVHLADVQGYERKARAGTRLQAADAAEIRRRYHEEKARITDLAREYAISTSHVSMIVTGDLWKNAEATVARSS